MTAYDSAAAHQLKFGRVTDVDLIETGFFKVAVVGVTPEMAILFRPSGQIPYDSVNRRSDCELAVGSCAGAQPP
jgi:hypothetical protein